MTREGLRNPHGFCQIPVGALSGGSPPETPTEQGKELQAGCSSLGVTPLKSCAGKHFQPPCTVGSAALGGLELPVQVPPSRGWG